MASIGDITWPLLIVGVLYYYHNDIKAALARIKSVGPHGLTLEPTPTQRVSTATVGDTGIVPSDTGVATLGKTANERINIVKQFISPEQLEPSVQSIKQELVTASRDKDEQIDLLAYVLASTNIQLVHERTYRNIFGSQMQALLSINNPGGATDQAVRKIYDEAAAQNAEVYEKISFQQWTDFLLLSGLIARTGDRYELTPYGRGFLKYVVDARLMTPKAY
jgi:hypothetical protein